MSLSTLKIISQEKNDQKIIHHRNNCLLSVAFKCTGMSAHMPRLVKNGNYTQLIVDNKPFLILGGELGNSSASSNDIHATNMAKAEANESEYGLCTCLLGIDGTS